MSKEYIKWCACKDHNATDWTVVSNFYAKHFIPKTWIFEYCTIDSYDDDRTLYITGACDCCGGFMRSGTSVPINIKGDELLAYVYQQMIHFRPYDNHDFHSGIYHSCVSQRARWYQQQNDFTLEMRSMSTPI